MRLNISHSTRYGYDGPVTYGLQELRLMPLTGPGQTVVSWNIAIEGGSKSAAFQDQHGNEVWLVNFAGDRREIVVTCKGIVDTDDTSGVYGPHRGYAPLWYFQRMTPLTHPGANLRKLTKGLSIDAGTEIPQLHALSARILDHVAYQTGTTTATHTAEEALSARTGVCQDHSHIFIAACRLLGLPARYVSGYLMLDQTTHQDATHAWAEAHIDGLGWVGFDVSNAMSPDERYVRVATGLDYSDAAPISGMRFGNTGSESLVVDIQVAQ